MHGCRKVEMVEAEVDVGDAEEASSGPVMCCQSTEYCLLFWIQNTDDIIYGS